jgi:hypothetical protein
MARAVGSEMVLRGFEMISIRLGTLKVWLAPSSLTISLARCDFATTESYVTVHNKHSGEWGS